MISVCMRVSMISVCMRVSMVSVCMCVTMISVCMCVTIISVCMGVSKRTRVCKCLYDKPYQVESYQPTRTKVCHDSSFSNSSANTE